MSVDRSPSPGNTWADTKNGAMSKTLQKVLNEMTIELTFEKFLRISRAVQDFKKFLHSKWHSQKCLHSLCAKTESSVQLVRCAGLSKPHHCTLEYGVASISRLLKIIGLFCRI